MNVCHKNNWNDFVLECEIIMRKYIVEWVSAVSLNILWWNTYILNLRYFSWKGIRSMVG